MVQNRRATPNFYDKEKESRKKNPRTVGKTGNGTPSERHVIRSAFLVDRLGQQTRIEQGEKPSNGNSGQKTPRSAWARKRQSARPAGEAQGFVCSLR